MAKDFPAEAIGVMDDEESGCGSHFWFDIDLYKRAVENVTDYLCDLIPTEDAMIRSTQKPIKRNWIKCSLIAKRRWTQSRKSRAI